MVSGFSMALIACHNPSESKEGNTMGKTDNQVKHAPVIAGGYAPRPTIDTEIQAAADFAANALSKGQAKVQAITHAESQVVAGMNYRMDITLTNGSTYNVTVYKALNGKMELTQSIAK